MASFRKLDSGNWRAEVARKGKRLSRVFPTKLAAKEWAARQEYLILDAAEKPEDHGSFGDMLDRYAREVSAKKRGGRWEEIRIERLRRDDIAKINLANLTPSVFAAWRDRRLTEVAPASVIRELQLMSSALNTARREWGMIHANPISEIRKPAKPPPRDRLPSDEEIERLGHAAGSDLATATARAFHAFRFALETAMRAGESAAARGRAAGGAAHLRAHRSRLSARASPLSGGEGIPGCPSPLVRRWRRTPKPR